MTKETTAKIELTEQEANLIISAIDLSIKNGLGGLQVVQYALAFVGKLQESFKDLSIEKESDKGSK